MDLPGPILIVLEGESLVNDATAPIALGFALPQRTAGWPCSFLQQSARRNRHASLVRADKRGMEWKTSNGRLPWPPTGVADVRRMPQTGRLVKDVSNELETELLEDFLRSMIVGVMPGVDF
jgi:hypothetical protein